MVARERAKTPYGAADRVSVGVEDAGDYEQKAQRDGPGGDPVRAVAEPFHWGALATPRETLNDPQVEPNGYVVTNVDDHGEKYRIVAAPVQFNETPPAPARAPEHGQHTEEILLELGVQWDDIAKAKELNAIL